MKVASKLVYRTQKREYLGHVQTGWGERKCASYSVWRTVNISDTLAAAKQWAEEHRTPTTQWRVRHGQKVYKLYE